MADRMRAKRGFLYPVGAESLQMVIDAGGLSKLTPAQLATVAFKAVSPGDWCDDMPEGSLALYLARGEVERVSEAPLTADDVAEFNAEAEAEMPNLRRLRVGKE